MILSEIGDIQQFTNPSKLFAYAGLDPLVYQSGNFQVNNTRMSKRTSYVLRYTLANAAHNAVKNNSTFKTYYNPKIAEGSSHYKTNGKLVGIILKTMTSNVSFLLSNKSGCKLLRLENGIY